MLLPRDASGRLTALVFRTAGASIVPIVATPALAVQLDVYGLLNVTLQNSDEATEEQVELQSNASRIGVKGSEPVSDGLEVIYQLEWGVDYDGASRDGDIYSRNQFVGLAGRFGTIKVGRHDTALKEAPGEFDLFEELEGDVGETFNGENRLGNYIGYSTPTFAHAFSATVNFFPDVDDPEADDGDADGISASLTYQTERFYAAIAFDHDIDGDDVNTTRLAGGYTRGPAQLMLLYQHTAARDADGDGFGVSLAWTIGDATAKLQYLDADLWRTDPQPDPLDNLFEWSLSLGLDYALDEGTKLFGFYTTGEIGGTRESHRYAAMGLEHEF